MIYIAFLQHPDLKKKKRSTYQPSQSSGQTGKQTFIFLGLMCSSSAPALTPFRLIYTYSIPGILTETAGFTMHALPWRQASSLSQLGGILHTGWMNCKETTQTYKPSNFLDSWNTVIFLYYATHFYSLFES